jgi:hypothetical protein
MSIFDEQDEQEQEPEYVGQDNAATEAEEDEVGLHFRSTPDGRITTAGLDVGGYDNLSDIDPILQEHALNRYSPAQVQAFQKYERSREPRVDQEPPQEIPEIQCGCGCGARRKVSEAGYGRFIEIEGVPHVEYTFGCGSRFAAHAEDLPAEELHRQLDQQEIIEEICEDYNIPKPKSARR